jgi:hypothetical protein
VSERRKIHFPRWISRVISEKDGLKATPVAQALQCITARGEQGEEIWWVLRSGFW